MEAAEIQKQLEELETKAEQLRALYEQYFMGIERLEPLVLRREVDRRIKLLRRDQIRNTAQRFKFNTLVQRFNVMQQHWARVVREIENGTYKRDLMRAAARFGQSALAGVSKAKLRDLDLPREMDEVVELEPDPDPDPLPAAHPSTADSFELAADDLVDDADDADDAHDAHDADDDDEPPTPPRLVRPAPLTSPVATAAQVPVAARSFGVIDMDLGLDSQDPPLQPPPRPQPVAPPASKPSGFGKIDIDVGLGSDLDQPAAPAAPAAAGPAPTVRTPSTNEPARLRLGATPVMPGIFRSPLAPRAPSATPPAAPSSMAPTRVTAPAATPVGASRPEARPEPRRGPQPVAPVPAPAAQTGDLGERRVREIYDRYIEARAKTREGANVSFEALAASLRAQSEKLRAMHPNRAVDYEVVIKDGKTHLRPVVK